jgi:hypothetical protein
MSGINAGKVVIGGLLAGLVYNVLDFLNNAVFVGDDFRANAVRLGLDPAAAESPTGIATWVVIDFLFGILVVWTYAAVRPRFGPGPKTAIYAGLIPYLAVTLIMFGLTQGGIVPVGLWGKMAVLSLITTSLGAVAGAWAYKES